MSEVAGTTTDPVVKAMEWHPLGPVLFLDTAGFDDEGGLGIQRVERTEKTLERVDVALLVFAGKDITDECAFAARLKERGIPHRGGAQPDRPSHRRGGVLPPEPHPGGGCPRSGTGQCVEAARLGGGTGGIGARHAGGFRRPQYCGRAGRAGGYGAAGNASGHPGA